MFKIPETQPKWDKNEVAQLIVEKKNLQEFVFILKQPPGLGF